MKGKMFRKITALAATAAMSVMMMSSIVSAGTVYTPIKGTSTQFNKYLIMDVGDKVPNATFTFTIEAGTARSASTSDNEKMQVLPGVGVSDITISEAVFEPDNTTYDSVQTGDVDISRTAAERKSGDTAATGVQFDNTDTNKPEKYAKQPVTIDFSKVEFDEPGIYRYIVKEVASTEHANAGIMHDTDIDRVLDVYVIDDSSADETTGDLVKKLMVQSYVLHTTDGDVNIGTDMGSADVTQNGDALADKSDGFTNEYNSKDLKVEKEVVGNQASRDKYFEFTVKTTAHVADGDKFVVSIADDNDANTNDGNADATSGTNSATITANAGQTNPQLVTGADLNAGVKFYLQHGQSIVVRGLPLNAGYKVTENAEDYKSTQKTGDTNEGNIGTVAGANKMATAGFTNTREGIIPTGIIISVAGLLIVGIIAVIGFVFFGIRSKKRYDED